MRPIAEAEIAREGRRVLRPLCEKGAVLIPARNGDYAVRTTGKRNGIARLRKAVFAEFLRRGWVSPGDPHTKTFVLSDVGKGWLERALNPQEPFAAQHRLISRRTLRDDSGREHTVMVDEAESPLAWLRARGLLSARQFAAGERLRRDFTLSQLMPRLCADLSAPAIGARRGAKFAAEIPDTVLAAKQRFDRAMRAAGPGLSDILFDVCCHLKGLALAERENDWPRHSGFVVLKLALDRLAAHYGPSAPRERAHTRSWRMEEEALFDSA